MVISSGVKCLGLEIDRLTPSSIKAKNCLSYTFTPVFKVWTGAASPFMV
jgi:hypothetical protein